MLEENDNHKQYGPFKNECINVVNDRNGKS